MSLVQENSRHALSLVATEFEDAPNQNLDMRWSMNLREKIVDRVLRRGMPKEEMPRAFGVGVFSSQRYLTMA